MQAVAAQKERKGLTVCIGAVQDGSLKGLLSQHRPELRLAWFKILDEWLACSV